MNILVTGATGVVGRRLIPLLKDASGWAPKYASVGDAWRPLVAQLGA